eukprot:6184874-Pleurochrysis_carterae.AAC.1
MPPNQSCKVACGAQLRCHQQSRMSRGAVVRTCEVNARKGLDKSLIPSQRLAPLVSDLLVCCVQRARRKTVRNSRMQRIQLCSISTQ